MQRASFSQLFAMVAAAALITGCSSAPTKKDYSGYLGDYSDLKEAKTPGGVEVMRYVSPKFTPANYHAVIVQKVQFYPKPEPTDQLSQQTIDEIGNYMNTAVREKIAAKVQVVDTPGPGVANLRWAITGVAPDKMGLKPYQVIPIAFVVTMISRGVAGTPEEAKIVVEAEVTDSVSKEILLKVVRAGTGEELKKTPQETQEGKKEIREVTLDSVKPLIDKWAEGVAEGATQFVKPK
jgi:hypothetical protein